MKSIMLSNGFFSEVDDIDFAFVSTYIWHGRQDTYTRKAKTWYAWSRGSNGVTIYMHRLIVESQGTKLGKLLVDHKDRSGLNNQRSNLRVAIKASI